MCIYEESDSGRITGSPLYFPLKLPKFSPTVFNSCFLIIVTQLSSSRKGSFLNMMRINFIKIKVLCHFISMYFISIKFLNYCILQLQEKCRKKFCEKEFSVPGLWFVSRETIPALTSDFLKGLCGEKNQSQAMAEAIILNSQGILHHHLY